MIEKEQEGRLQNVIPDEMMMKYVRMELRDLRRELAKAEKRIEETERYAKGLEEENMLLQTRINEYEALLEGVTDKRDFPSRIARKIAGLQDYIKKVFPKRAVKLSVLKRKIINQSAYISRLQALLRDNGLAYPPLEEDPQTIQGVGVINDLDVFAVRGKHERFESDPLDTDKVCG